MIPSELQNIGKSVGRLLRGRNETICVAEGSAGGLISASLLCVPGASAYYVGGLIIYTAQAKKVFLGNAIPQPDGLRGATEDFSRFLADSARERLGTTWALSEAGAAGPANGYGDPAGHSWLAVAGPTNLTRHVLTNNEDRVANMVAFSMAALSLLEEALLAAES